MGQLLSASVSNIGGSTYSVGYNYGRDGNIRSLTVGGSTVDFEYDSDSDGLDDSDLMTKIGTDSLSWNLNGNLDNSVTASFTYDWDNKLRFAQSGSNTIEIRYDPRGNRIYKSVDDGENITERKYIVDIVGRLPVILCEIDPQNGGSLTNKYYYANSQILAQDAVYYTDPNDPNTIGFDRYYYLHDRLGSVRQVIDHTAATVATYTYNPYGQDFASECSESIYNPFKFTGQWYDSKTGQYWLRERQYEPQLMRFTTRDPVFGKFFKPLTLHKYLYCNNDSINRRDLTGRSYSQIAGAVIGGTAMYATSIGVTAHGVSTNNDKLIELGIELMRWVPASAAVGALVGANAPAIKAFVLATTATLIHNAFTPEGMTDISYVLGGDPHLPFTPSGWVVYTAIEILDWDLDEIRYGAGIDGFIDYVEDKWWD